MKPILLLLSSTFLILHSCKNSIEKTNERIKSSILEKGKEIQENYIQYKLDIENSGYNNLLSFERIEKDKDYLESKEIIKKTDSIFSNFNQRNKYLYLDIKKMFDSLQPTNNLKRNEIDLLIKKIDELNENTISNYKIDSTIISINKEILDLLLNCDYEIQDGYPVFNSKICAFDYNDKIIKLNLTQLKVRNQTLKNKLNSNN